MFTGLIRHQGTFRGLRGSQLSLHWPGRPQDLILGDSVAVMGICLTVTGLKEALVDFEVGPQTRRTTTVLAWKLGQSLNLEGALKLGDPLGGHLVQGHVQGVARALRWRPWDGAWLLEVVLPSPWGSRVRAQQSIALDGISLTVYGASAQGIRCQVLPLTWDLTSLKALKPGQGMNFELDGLGAAPGLDFSQLTEWGYGHG